MGMSPPTRDQLREVLRAHELEPVKAEAAKSLNMAVSTYKDWLKRALDSAARGEFGTEPTIPGFRISKETAVYDQGGNLVREFIQQKPAPDGPFNLPEGHRIKGVSALLDAQGNVTAQWVKTREGELDPLWLVDHLKEALTDYQSPHIPVLAPDQTSDALLNLIPCNDWHINMQIWGQEASQNWDLKIAEETIGGAVTEVISRAPRAQCAIVLGGGDLLHADNNNNRTEKSGNVLDADQRHQKGLDAAMRLKVLTIDTALRYNSRVVVRILSGNHDPYSSVAIAYFLLAYYRNDPRVTVDVDPSLFFWHRFGLVLLGATHGHTVKLQDMAQIMAHRRAEDWGKTRFRYIHGFHVHHKQKFVTEGEGVVMESHQAPIPMDAYHFGAGYLSGRSLQSITYHHDYGEIGRVRQAILDAA